MVVGGRRVRRGSVNALPEHTTSRTHEDRTRESARLARLSVLPQTHDQSTHATPTQGVISRFATHASAGSVVQGRPEQVLPRGSWDEIPTRLL